MNEYIIQWFPTPVEQLTAAVLLLKMKLHAAAANILHVLHVLHQGVAVGMKEHTAVSETAARLLEVHGNSILRMAYSYMHNISEAEDILQDTLLQYIKTVPEFESDSHEKAWLLRVAANLCKNRLKYNELRRADELDETLTAQEREDLSFVWEAVRSLPEQYREVIHLFYYEGYSTAQIGMILSQKEVTVRSNLYRGRGRLKEILKEAYDFE